MKKTSLSSATLLWQPVNYELFPRKFIKKIIEFDCQLELFAYLTPMI